MKKKAVSKKKAVTRVSRRLGRPVKVTQESLAEAASKIGLADFRLSEVAERLGVALQTLYNHVEDREELLHLAAQVLEKRFPFPSDLESDWVAWWRTWAHTMKAMYKLHHGLATILMSRPLVNSPPLTQHWETAQIVAERFGFKPAVALWANMAVHEFVYSWASREDQSRRPVRAYNNPKPGKNFAEEAPRFLAAVSRVSKYSHDQRFDMTLEALLAGLATWKGRDLP